MQRRQLVISINSAWNIVNFRLGLIRGLEKAGYKVIAIAPPDSYVSQIETAGAAFYPIQMDKKGISPIKDLVLLVRYHRLLRKLKADVLLAYTAKPNIFGSLAAHFVGTKVINNVSGLGTAFIRGGWLSRVVSWLYRLAFRRSSTVFFQNDEDRELFARNRLVRPAQAKLLPGSGIDLERFRPAINEGGHGDDFRFLLIGRVIRDKGVTEYAEAARRLRAKRPAARFQLLGAIDAENRTAIPRETVDAWIDGGLIEYLGEADDVRPFIAAADCVVLPSYREGLPRALLEAAAMAKPLVATCVPGCRQVVEHGVNGLLCEARNVDSLTAVMIEMMEAPQRVRDQWGHAGRALVERDFDEKIVIQRYLDAIEDALARPNPQRGAAPV